MHSSEPSTDIDRSAEELTGTFSADIVIPVHLESRPVRRAVASVVDRNSADVRAIVVAHNIDPEIIRTNLGEHATRADVVILSLRDGIRSPAGPLNHGIEAATATYYGVLGSDDELEHGAVDSWLREAASTNADAVMARVHRSLSGPEALPPARPGRVRGLDAVRDRLSYRCVPQGLVSTERFGHLRFTPGLESGEDQEFTAQLWFTAERISYDRNGPAYVLHEDGDDRVTAATRSVEADFAFVDVIAGTEWFARLSGEQRTAWGVKTLRLHVMEAVAARLNAPEGIAAYSEQILHVVNRVEALCPGSLRQLCIADRIVIDELGKTRVDPVIIRKQLSFRWGGRIRALFPRNPLFVAHRQSHLRTMRDMRM